VKYQKTITHSPLVASSNHIILLLLTIRRNIPHLINPCLLFNRSYFAFVVYRIFDIFQNIRVALNPRNDLAPLAPKIVRAELRLCLVPDRRETENNLNIRQRTRSRRYPQTNPGNSFCGQLSTQCLMATNGEVTKPAHGTEVDSTDPCNDSWVLETTVPRSLTVSAAWERAPLPWPR